MRIPNRHVLVGQVLGGLFVQTGGQVGVRSGGDALAVEDVSLQQREGEELLVDDLVEGDVEGGGGRGRGG